jgi:hypothetical protein
VVVIISMQGVMNALAGIFHAKIGPSGKLTGHGGDNSGDNFEPRLNRRRGARDQPVIVAMHYSGWKD